MNKNFHTITIRSPQQKLPLIDAKNLGTVRFKKKKTDNPFPFPFFPLSLSPFFLYPPHDSNVSSTAGTFPVGQGKFTMKRNRVGETYPRENTPRNATFPFVCTASPVVSVICLHGLCSSCNFKGNGLFRVASEETRRWCCSVLLSPEDRDRNGARAVRRIRYQVKYRMGWKLEFLRKYFYFNHRRWYL